MLRTLLLAGCSFMAAALPLTAFASPVFSSSSYTSSLTLSGGGSTDVATGVAYSNGFYYTGQGGTPESLERQFNSSGQLLASGSPSPGLDFRSLFTDAEGTVYARGYSSNVIYQQTSFGAFTAAVTLAGEIDDQAQVVLTGDGTHYVSNSLGNVTEWTLDGAVSGTFTLASDYGVDNSTISAFGSYLLNYSNGTLTAYSEATGAVVDSTTLVGGASGFYGSALANGRFFIASSDYSADQVGYDIGLQAVPEPASMTLLGLGLLGAGLARRRAA